jgi:hypothetical protein
MEIFHSLSFLKIASRHSCGHPGPLAGWSHFLLCIRLSPGCWEASQAFPSLGMNSVLLAKSYLHVEESHVEHSKTFLVLCCWVVAEVVALKFRPHCNLSEKEPFFFS